MVLVPSSQLNALPKGPLTGAESISVIPATDSTPATSTLQGTGNTSLSQIATRVNRTVTVFGSATVGTTALRITATSTVLSQPATIQSDPANTGDIGISGANTVTLANAGHILKPGQSFTYQGSNLNALWVISSAANQVIRWAA